MRFFFFFFRQMVPLSHTSLERGIHFNCCKYTVKYEKKKITETGSVLSFFTATKCACSQFFYPFTDRNGRFPFLSYTSTC